MSAGQENRINKVWVLPLTLLALLLGITAYLLLLPGEKTSPDRLTTVSLESGTLIPRTRPMTPFALTDHRGRPFTQSSVQGHWRLLSFGYTHCPDICPTTLAMLARLDDQLRQQAPEIDIRTAFVSIDPERDTEEVLADYVPYFNPDFIGVTGSPPEIEKLTGQLGILFQRVDGENSEMGYLMDHSASIILLNPQGEFQAVFGAPHQVNAMARDLQTLVQQHP
ncbi:MAG: SCO family protein [Sedimenticola sp.]|nr:SCO family protein [Sedimenticola sp.]